MKTFVAVYTGTPEARSRSDWDALSDEERRSRELEGMRAWGAWMEANADALVDTGGPLGKTKRVSAAGIEDARNALVGYVVLRAESHAAAAEKFRDHPHFTVFPGEAVEIMEVLPIPEI